MTGCIAYYQVSTGKQRAICLGKVLLLLCTCLLFSISSSAQNWNQAAGPNGNWTAKAKNVPTQWSVARGQNIIWRTTLPETGQSGIAVWGDRLFLTTMKPLQSDADKKRGA